MGLIDKNNIPSTKTVFDRIDTGKIKTGGHFREGKFDSKKNVGLKGQLGKLKRAGRFTTTANLSKKNLQTMYDLVNERMKNKAVTAKAGITRKDKKKIMHEAYKLTRQPGADFTKEDMKDLRKVVDRLKSTSEEAVIPTKSSGNINTSADDFDSQQITTSRVNKFLGPAIKSSVSSVGSKLYSKFSSRPTSIKAGADNNESISKDKFRGDIIDSDGSDDIPDPADAKDLPI